MRINPIIIDYGVGNLYSLRKAIEFLGIEVNISNNPETIKKASHIFLPGVGSFFKATETLKELKLFNFLKNLDYKKYKLMGICLGMQLLFDSSAEDQLSNGLSLINGSVKKLNIQNNKNKSYKIPNIGWHNIEKKNSLQKEKILHNINLDKEKFYFVHSYHATGVQNNNLTAYIKYNDIIIPAIVKKGNIIGTQFHPEKSKSQGINLIKNFLQ